MSDWKDDALRPLSENPNRARDHLANERTFLAWVRTGIAIVVFGFAIGRFAVAIHQFMGGEERTAGVTVWLGTVAIIGGVLLTLAGLIRYRRTYNHLEKGEFAPAGFLVDVIAIVTAVFGLVLAAYLIYIDLL